MPDLVKATPAVRSIAQLADVVQRAQEDTGNAAKTAATINAYGTDSWEDSE